MGYALKVKSPNPQTQLENSSSVGKRNGNKTLQFLIWNAQMTSLLAVEYKKP